MQLLRTYIIGILVLTHLTACGQTYKEEMSNYRKQYIAALKAEQRQPIKPGDEKFIEFFEPDEQYKVTGTVKLSPGATPFLIPTHSGKQKPFVEYCTIEFKLKDTVLTLHAYQSMNPMQQGDNDELFIPFNDRTNYDYTYGGGRYLDIKKGEIKNDVVTLDFNKCYNPYCAYSDGFSCPIPPQENYLKISVFAGEKLFKAQLY